VLFGTPVTGLGFDERSCPRVRGFELAQALRLVAEHAPADDPDRCRMLAYRAWEVEALALRGDAEAAANHLRTSVEPLIAALPSALRTRCEALARDLLQVLEGGTP
jgi:hypothetical protein